MVSDQKNGIKIKEKDSSDSESDDEKRKLTAPLPVITASSTAHAPMLKTVYSSKIIIQSLA